MLAAAETAYRALETVCGPGGCQLGDGLLTTSSWSFVRTQLFERWLFFFGETPYAAVYGGCTNGRMLRDPAGFWRFDGMAGTCSGQSDCLTFDGPRGTARAAIAFYDSLPVVTPMPAASIAVDPQAIAVGAPSR